jgi:RNA:NAD 2'-phosphotransferase (TPT1/KptA family)
MAFRVLRVIDLFCTLLQKSPQHNCFYHFTDTRNLPSIRNHGLLSTRKLEELGIEIAAPGGNDWSRDADRMKGMDAFVHLCLMRNHGMEHGARHDGRIKESIFLQIEPQVLRLPGVKVTLDVANNRHWT